MFQFFVLKNNKSIVFYNRFIDVKFVEKNIFF